MELKKKSLIEFREEVQNFLKKTYKKHMENKQGSFLFILDRVKDLHDDYKEVYGHAEGDLLLTYVSDMRRDNYDYFLSSYRLASDMYDKYNEEIKNNSIVIKNLSGIYERFRAIKIINQLYDLNIDVKQINKINLFDPGTYYIDNISIKLYKDLSTIKITELKNSKYTMKKRKEIQGIKRVK